MSNNLLAKRGGKLSSKRHEARRATCAKQLAEIDRPTLVICGREDRIVDPRAVYDAVKDLSSFQFKMIPRCGHAPQLECSTLVNRMVLRFLNRAIARS
jgi:pimeloyl-ACP methyl ester carboxylesterase